MPELPEVQTTVDGLSKYILGETVKQAKFYRENIRYPLQNSWLDEIKGKKIIKITRRAKLIIMQLSSKNETVFLLWQLGMSGSMRVSSLDESLRKHDHIEFIFQDKAMRYHDPRRFGSMRLFQTIKELQEVIKHYGLEPLAKEFTAKYLLEKSKKRKVAIKNFIMNQEIVVGVGNIYACEALFVSKTNPLKSVNKITKKEYEILVKAIKNILKQAIKQGGTTLKDFENADAKPGYFQQQLQVYGRNKQLCNICETEIEAVVIGGRNSFYCPKCQK